jgi:hypothetical protein
MPKNNHGDPEGRLGGPPVDLNLPAAPGATEDVTGEGEDMPAQEAAAEASQAVSAAVDWRAVAQEWMQLQAFRAANPWARREAS